MGLRWILRRGYYEAVQKPYLLARQLPVTSWEKQPLSGFLCDGVPANPVDYAEWRHCQSVNFFFNTLPDIPTLRSLSCERAVQQAEELLSGTWLFFGALPVEAGFPPNWDTNPVTGQRVATDRHWSEVSDFAFGDVKLIWEASRFSPAYALVRAYAITRDERYPEAFWRLVEDWAAHNPPQLGINWKCGQEATFRLMAWCFGLYGFAASRHTTPERIAALAAMIAVTAQRIEANLGYALSQRNNHGISEAAGLFTVGALFPEFRRADFWRRRGRELLEQQARIQFYDDGSYIQHSTNYHRVAFDDYLWALRLAEVHGKPFSSELYDRLRHSVDFLDALTDERSGSVPNHGNNDGSLVLPLTDCAYGDFRPCIQAMRYLTSRCRQFDSGPWNETLLWLFGEGSLAVPTCPASQGPLNASFGGYYTLRGPESWGMIRCAEYRDRPAHADQLHFDLWWRGLNIACDAGTYLYNPEPEWEGTFSGTAVHNTVTVDGSDQMRRFSRFLWLDWARGFVRHDLHKGEWDCWEGEHRGYKRFSVTHRRCVIRRGDTWIVVDDVLGNGRHRARLHWLFGNFPLESDATGTVRLSTSAGVVQVRVVSNSPAELNLARAGQIVAGKSPSDNNLGRGWVSRIYAQKEPAVSLVVNVEAQLPTRFVTVFEFEPTAVGNLSVSEIALNDDQKVKVWINAPGASRILRSVGSDPLDSPRSPIHVLLLHQAFASPSEGGGTRHYELGKRLVDRGHAFTVVASDLSYLSGEQVVARRGLFTEQNISGLQVLRAYAYPALHRSFIWRVFSFLTFVCSSLLTGLSVGQVDLVMGTSPPIFQALSACVIAFLRRRPFLLEIRDLWPEFAIDMGVLRNPLLIWISRLVERYLYARASHIVVNSPAYRGYLLALDVAPLKISLIPNGVDPAMFDPALSGKAVRDKWGLAGKFVVLYAGAIGMANDLATVLNAAERLSVCTDIVFLLVGDGKERGQLEAQVRQRDLRNVIFTGTVGKNEVAKMMAAADACLAILKNIPMFRTTYPNKVFDYMAAGRPTLLAIDGVIREVVEACQGGIYIPPGDECALADAVLRLRAAPAEARGMGERARAYVIEHFHRDRQGAQFVSLVESMVEEWREQGSHFYRQFGKRLFDLLLAMLLTLLFSPVLLLLALVVKLTSRGPIFFNQQRLGKQGRAFKAYKFRTMLDRVRIHHVEIREDNLELTRFGRFLRRCKLDELPQLLNVLKGDMSLVGPRPPLPSQLAQYDSKTLRRLNVTPGMTGLAQVRGGTRMSWQERWVYDLEYVRRVSFPLDLSILLRTLLVVVFGEGRFYTPPKTND
jgi:lipopolysaccharide/colanic/teichoic acid biosynthesis glycosyltransferase